LGDAGVQVVMMMMMMMMMMMIITANPLQLLLDLLLSVDKEFPIR